MEIWGRRTGLGEDEGEKGQRREGGGGGREGAGTVVSSVGRCTEGSLSGDGRRMNGYCVYRSGG